MKKRNLAYLLTVCMTVLPLVGCGAVAKEADDGFESSESELASVEVEDDVVALSMPENSEPTVAEVCEGLRENYWDWARDYETFSYGWVKIDGDYYYYNETYPEDEWSVEEVAEYYRHYGYRWGSEIDELPSTTKKKYLWTSDYEHEFFADIVKNWLYIDGVKAAPLRLETHSMNPEDLVKAFQDKNWDGIELWYSDDFSTSVVVEPGYGLLKYSFQLDYYPEEWYPSELAYTDYYDAVPWWRDETNDFNVVAMPDRKYVRLTGGAAVPDYAVYSSGSVSSEAWAIAYVDVPWELQETLWAVRYAGDTYYDPSDDSRIAKHDFYAQRTADGLYGMVDSGVKLWRSGRLRQSWQLDLTEDSYLEVDFYGSGRNFVYTDGKLYELFDDGETEVLIDNIVSVNPSYKHGFVCVCFMLADDKVLRMGCIGNLSGGLVEKELASDVVAADLSNERLVLYTDTSGKTYAIYDFLGSDAGLAVLSYAQSSSYKIVCLGEGTIDDFKKLYEESGCSYNELIEEVSSAYSSKLNEMDAEPEA